MPEAVDTVDTNTQPADPPAQRATPITYTLPERGRPRNAAAGGSMCIYLRDAQQLDAFKTLVGRFGNSASQALQQIIKEVLASADRAPPEARSLDVKFTLHL